MSGGGDEAGLLEASGLLDSEARFILLPYEGDLASSDRSLVITVDIQSHGPEGLRSDYFATEGFTTKTADFPSSQYYDGRASTRISVDRRVPSSPATGIYAGIVQRVFSEIELSNADGALDSLAERGVDGRHVVIRAGAARADSNGNRVISFSEFGRLLDVAGDAWSYGTDTLRLSLQDQAALLRAPLQSKTYAGTGGIEGPPALKGKSKPLAYGHCFEIPLILLDAGLSIYQVSSGEIDGIEVIKDNGVVLGGVKGGIAGGFDELANVTPATGGWTEAKFAGLVRLGSIPAGQLTATVRGKSLRTRYTYVDTWSDGDLWDDLTGWVSETPAHGYSSTIGQIVLHMLTESARWGEERIDIDNLRNADEELPAPLGYYVGIDQTPTIEQAINDLCSNVGCFAGMDRLGRYQVGQIRKPAGFTPIVFDGRSIIGEPQVIALPYKIAPTGWKAGWRRYYVLQYVNGLAGSIREDPAAVQDLGQEYRVATAEDITRAIHNPTARISDVIPSAFTEEADAQAYANRLLETYNPGAKVIQFSTKLVGLYSLGDTVRLVYNRYGLDAGRNFVIVDMNIDYISNIVNLIVFG